MQLCFSVTLGVDQTHAPRKRHDGCGERAAWMGATASVQRVQGLFGQGTGLGCGNA